MDSDRITTAMSLTSSLAKLVAPPPAVFLPPFSLEMAYESPAVESSPIEEQQITDVPEPVGFVNMDDNFIVTQTTPEETEMGMSEMQETFRTFQTEETVAEIPEPVNDFVPDPSPSFTETLVGFDPSRYLNTGSNNVAPSREYAENDVKSTDFNENEGQIEDSENHFVRSSDPIGQGSQDVVQMLRELSALKDQ